MAGPLPVIAHCGAQTTAETVALAEHAAGVGVAGVAVIAPPVLHPRRGRAARALRRRGARMRADAVLRLRARARLRVLDPGCGDRTAPRDGRQPRGDEGERHAVREGVAVHARGARRADRRRGADRPGARRRRRRRGVRARVRVPGGRRGRGPERRLDRCRRAAGDGRAVPADRRAEGGGRCARRPDSTRTSGRRCAGSPTTSGASCSTRSRARRARRSPAGRGRARRREARRRCRSRPRRPPTRNPSPRRLLLDVGARLVELGAQVVGRRRLRLEGRLRTPAPHERAQNEHGGDEQDQAALHWGDATLPPLLATPIAPFAEAASRRRGRFSP